MNKTFRTMSLAGILILAFLTTNLRAQSNNPSIQGTWVTEQIYVEKIIDGKEEKAVFFTSSKLKSYIPCPQEWEFRDSQTIVFRYPDNREEVSSYKLEGNKLETDASGAILIFNYQITDEYLMLTITHKVDFSKPNGDIGHTIEKWTIQLTKKIL